MRGDKKEGVRFPLILTPALAKRVEDYRFKRRFKSNTAAIERLLEFALKQNPPREDEPKGEK
jgi:hypothetical protein